VEGGPKGRMRVLRKRGKMDNKMTLELTFEQMVQFMNFIREDVIVNVTIDEEGGDKDDRREEV